MNKTLTNLLRSAFVAVCCICGISATFAQAEVSVNSGGVTNDDFSGSIGEAVVSANAGLWADAVAVTLGIDDIYTDGEIVVGNSAANQSLDIQLSEAVIADGAYYNVYTVNGMLLASDKITSSPYTLKYGEYVTGNVVVVTINTSKGVVATYKLTK